MKILLSLSRENRKEGFLHCFSDWDGELCGGYLPRDEGCDALILGGGGDLKPQAGEDASLFWDVDEKREEWERELIGAFVKTGRPILGICRGHQLLARYFDGRLLPSLSDSRLHRAQGRELYHCVEREEGCFLSSDFPRRFSVNSNHHHGVELSESPLRGVAFSSDGLCEALEHPFLPVWGVQWHPERMAEGKAFFAMLLRRMEEYKKGVKPKA